MYSEEVYRHIEEVLDVVEAACRRGLLKIELVEELELRKRALQRGDSREVTRIEAELVAMGMSKDEILSSLDDDAEMAEENSHQKSAAEAEKRKKKKMKTKSAAVKVPDAANGMAGVELGESSNNEGEEEGEEEDAADADGRKCKELCK